MELKLENRKFIQEYEINADTMIIIPEGLTHSIVYELGEEYLVPSTPLEIIKKGCSYFGTSFNGRRDGTKELVGLSVKAPILIDPHTPIYMFPTSSPQQPHCIWVNPDYITSHVKTESNKSTFITFCNNQTYEVPVSNVSFANQIGRTARLRLKYSNNVKRMEDQTRSKTKRFYFRAAEEKGKYDSKE